jgi:hypothetical protein
MNSNVKKWIRGLVSTAISSAAGGVALVIVDPSTFNLQSGIRKLFEVCAALVLVHVAAYLQKSPLWEDDAKSTPEGGAVKTLSLILFLILFGGIASAQSAQSAQLQNIYGAGVSYNVGGSPAIAGTALYAHQVSADTAPNLYAFTAVDALPNTLKPFTVSTNVGIGIAQKVATLGKVPIFMPTAAGISFNGSNTGWQWNGGVLASIHIKGQYYVMPTVRFLKSSVSNGTGYQPIVGVLFGWGQ